MYLHTIAFISVYNLTGWWFQPSEKYEFVSWDDDIPKIWSLNPFHGSKMFQTTNQLKHTHTLYESDEEFQQPKNPSISGPTGAPDSDIT